MKAFSFVFVATLIARFSSLISFPITARVLPVSDMGELTIWHSLRGIVLLAALAGLPEVVAREAGAHRSQHAFGEAMKISYLILAILALLLEAALLFAPELVTVPHPQLLLAAAAIDIVPGLFLSALAASGQIRAYAVCIAVPALVVASLSAMLVLPPFALGLAGPLYAHLVASSVNAVMCLWMWRRHQEPVDAPHRSFGSLLRQSMPVLGVSLVGMSIATIDRYSIRWFLGAAAVGFYAVSYQVAALLSFGGSAVRTSLVARIIADAEQPPRIARYFRHYLACGGMFAIFLAAMAPEIVRVLAGAKYESNVQLIPMLCGAILALELYSFGQSLSVARRTAQHAFYAIVAGAVLAIIVVPALCFWIGEAGVPLGLLASYSVAATVLLGRQAAFTWRAWATLAVVALVLALLWASYADVAAIHAMWARALRYAVAAAAVIGGLASLRALGKEETP